MESFGELVSDEEMLGDFKLALHSALREGRLTATALVAGLKAIQGMIPPPPPKVADDTARFSVIDQLDSLPKTEGRKLLKQEIKRYRSELADLEAAFIATGEKK